MDKLFPHLYPGLPLPEDMFGRGRLPVRPLQLSDLEALADAVPAWKRQQQLSRQQPRAAAPTPRVIRLPSYELPPGPATRAMGGEVGYPRLVGPALREIGGQGLVDAVKAQRALRKEAAAARKRAEEEAAAAAAAAASAEAVAAEELEPKSTGMGGRFGGGSSSSEPEPSAAPSSSLLARRGGAPFSAGLRRGSGVDSIHSVWLSLPRCIVYWMISPFKTRTARPEDWGRSEDARLLYREA